MTDATAGAHERSDKPRGPISRQRIESLSDLIFGLALSLGALDLIANPPTTPADLTTRLIAFIFNFVILVAVWLQYTMVMSKMPVETGRMVFANCLLLLLIILMSYLIVGITFTSPPLPIPAKTPFDAYSSQLYGLVLAGVCGILSFLGYNLSMEEKRLIPQGYLHRARLASYTNASFAGLFLFTCLPQAWEWSIYQVPIRFGLWWVPLIGTICINVLLLKDPGSR